MDVGLRTAAQQAPHRLALVHPDGAYTYSDLAERVFSVCAALDQRGIPRKDVVAIRASNRWQTVVLLLALIERGTPFVPIHPRYTDHELSFVQKDAAVDRVFADSDVDSLIDTSSTGLSSHAVISDEETLAILYSSGTTGTPKGAILSRAAFWASAKGSAENLGFCEDDRWLVCLPLCHIGGLSIVTRCVLARACMVLLPRFSAASVLEAIEAHRVTLLSVVPTMLHALLEADERGILSRLRAVLCGGAATPFPLLSRAVDRGVNVLCTYGLTEACSQVTVQKWLPKPLARRGSGSPLQGVEVAIRGEAGSFLPSGQVGQIVVKGRSVMTGYLHRPPLAGDWLDTGDLGELDDSGTLFVHARRTDLIVTGGENVYPAEVEQALLTIPQVRDALVFGIPDEVWGALVCAALVVEKDFDQKQMESALAERLAKFKRPRRFVVVDSFPELPNGKRDRLRAITRFGPMVQSPCTLRAGQGEPGAV
jgi:O-succinylbenzoic acid--CoA ligase